MECNGLRGAGVSGLAHNPEVVGTSPARIKEFFFLIIEEHARIIVTLKISELKSVANPRDVHVVKDEGWWRSLDRVVVLCNCA